MSAILGGVTPAGAATLDGGCFERVAGFIHRHTTRAHAPTTSRIPIGIRPHRRVTHRIAGAPRPRPIASRYVMRPTACRAAHAGVPYSSIPGAERPESGEELLARLAAPPAAEAHAVEASSLAAAGPQDALTGGAETAAAPDDYGQFFPGGGGGGGGGGGFPSPGSAIASIDVLPVIIIGPTQPETPGLIPPDDAPSDLTPGAPGIPGPPDASPGGGFFLPPGGGGPPVGVPEPTVWALMILGFGAVGLAQRRRRARSLEARR